MKRFTFLTLALLQVLFNGAMTPIYYYWLRTKYERYSLVISCLYGVALLPLAFNRRYNFVIISLVARCVPLIVDIGLLVNFITSEYNYFYIQLIANIIFDIAIYIFGIFYAGSLAREIIDPYARFGDVTVFTQ